MGNVITYFYNLCFNKYNLILESPSNYKKGEEEFYLKNNILNHQIINVMKIFLEENFNYDDNLIISLSGGVDSMVILSSILYINLNYDNKYNLYAVHVNYNIRNESVDEEKFLVNFCEFWKVNLLVKKINNKGKSTSNRIFKSEEGIKITRNEYEEETKKIRFDAYKDLINNKNCKGVFLGHHKDDLIENIFTNSMKGHNILDLEVMKDVGIIKDIKFCRPLLNLHKKDIIDFSMIFKIPYFKDSTPKWSRRGKMRNEIFPLLDNVFNSGWKNKLKEIGNQSNMWRSTVDNLIIKPWIETVNFNSNGFQFKIDHLDDINLWCYFLPKLFYKKNFKPIKKKSIINLVKKLNEQNNLKYQNNFLKVELDSSFSSLSVNGVIKISKNE